MYVCFLLTHPATILSHANRPHGLKAEAIANEKWGIATDRLKKMKKSALLVSGSALWVFGSCALGSWFLKC